MARRAAPRHWVVLVASAGLESAWALALDASEHFTRIGPTLLFLVACALSMLGLAYAMRGIALSVAYAIWTGLGAALTVTASMLTGAESASPLKIVFLAGIVGCVIGLKFVAEPGSRGAADAE